MTLRKMVSELISQGKQVKFFERSDRGIVVTEIDGVKFSNKEGNKAVRDIFGVTITERQSKQLEKAQKEKMKMTASKRQKLTPLPKDLQKALRRVQRIFRKENPKGKATITTKNVRWTLENEGLEEAFRRLRQAEKYAKGYAYTENLEALKQRLLQDIVSESSQEAVSDLTTIINDLDNLIKNDGMGFKEEQLQVFLQELYKWEQHQIKARTLLNRWKSLKGMA